MSGNSSASRLRNDTMGGSCWGYDEASVSRMRRICLQGAAHGVWKEMTARVVGGREDRCDRKAVSEEISVICDMLKVGGARSPDEASWKIDAT